MSIIKRSEHNYNIKQTQETVRTWTERSAIKTWVPSQSSTWHQCPLHSNSLWGDQPTCCWTRCCRCTVCFAWFACRHWTAHLGSGPARLSRSTERYTNWCSLCSGTASSQLASWYSKFCSCSPSFLSCIQLGPAGCNFQQSIALRISQREPYFAELRLFWPWQPYCWGKWWKLRKLASWSRSLSFLFQVYPEVRRRPCEHASLPH